MCVCVCLPKPKLFSHRINILFDLYTHTYTLCNNIQWFPLNRKQNVIEFGQWNRLNRITQIIQNEILFWIISPKNRNDWTMTKWNVGYHEWANVRNEWLIAILLSNYFWMQMKIYFMKNSPIVLEEARFSNEMNHGDCDTECYWIWSHFAINYWW